MDIEVHNNKLTNGYCTECSACGHSVCCPPTDCNMTGNNIHCKHYLQQLKIGYTCYQKVRNIIYDKQYKYPELWEEIENIWEDNEPSLFEEEK